MIQWLAILSVVLLLAGAALSWTAGSLLLSVGRREWSGAQPPAGAQEVSFSAADGTPLKGWWWPGGDSSRAIILLHGLGADRIQMLARAVWLHSEGRSVLLFDFRGCGRSGGRGSFGFAERLDVEAALDFLRDERGVDEITLMGQSMGAAAAVMAVAEWKDVRAAVLEHLYDRFESAIRIRVANRAGILEPILSPLLLMQVKPRLGFDPEDLSPVERLGRAPCPVLLGFGAKDRTLPREAAGALFRAGPYPTTLWILQSAGHQDLFEFDPDAYRKKVTQFLAGVGGAPQARAAR